MALPFTSIEDLAGAITIPEDGTLTRTIHEDASCKAILFGFSAGQELSEHTASMPAILHFLSGRATVTLGAETSQAGPGCWVHMAAQLPHAIRAEEPTVMLLTLLKA